MAELVSVIFVVESVGADAGGVDRFLSLLAQRLETPKREITLLLDGVRASEIRSRAGSDLHSLLKRQNVGLIAGTAAEPPLRSAAKFDWAGAVSAFRQRESEGFHAVEWLGGQLPVAVSTASHAVPQALGVYIDWGCRACVDQRSFYDDGTKPFFLGGRIQLSSLGPYWIDLSWHSLLDPVSLEGAMGQIERRCEQLAAIGGGTILVRLPANQIEAAQVEPVESAAAGLADLMTRSAALPGVAVESVRQWADRFADISYEHALQMSFFQSLASEVKEGSLRPMPYDLGYLSPAEQLYGLATIWLTSLQKGKAARNQVLRTPLGPATTCATDAGVRGIARDEIADVLAILSKAMEAGQLPPSVATRGGKIAVVDLLPTLAGGFEKMLEPDDLPIRRGQLESSALKAGRIDEAAETMGIDAEGRARLLAAAQNQIWTFKPVLDLTPSL